MQPIESGLEDSHCPRSLAPLSRTVSLIRNRYYISLWCSLCACFCHAFFGNWDLPIVAQLFVVSAFLMSVNIQDAKIRQLLLLSSLYYHPSH